MFVKRKATLAYLGCAIIVVGFGLASRRYGAYLPEFIASYAGDTLWALLVFLLISAVTPKTRLRNRATVALVISYLVEISQLYHAPWIDGIRHTTLGGLVLGFGFLWSDLVCYAVGVGIGLLFDWSTQSNLTSGRMDMYSGESANEES